MPKPPATVEDMTRWRNDWIPPVEQLAAQFESFDAAAVQPGQWAKTLEAQDAEYRRVFGGVHANAVFPARVAVQKFQDDYAKRFGESRRAEAMGLLQGFPNQSFSRAQALWELGRLVHSDEALRRALDRRAPLPDTPSARQYQASFATMLAGFGCTTDNGLFDLPTWRDGSAIPGAIIRAYAKQDESASPANASATQRERRIQLENQLRADAKNDRTLEPLLHQLALAQHLLPNLEDHNLLCDQRLYAANRTRWLRVGALLQTRGIVDAANDVFYYTRPELLEALEGGQRLAKNTVAERRRQQASYRATPPPLYLGQPPAATPTSGIEVPVEGTVHNSVRGAAASPGSYRGRARVLESLAEAETLEDGDILVTRSTTPPWTPYFGIIGALVTNSGGALSHGAVVAREFGIPAVVGTTNGTALIPDGATVTVDGSAGIVVIEAA